MSNNLCDLDTNLQDDIPRPLFVAVYTGNVKLVEMFLQYGSSMSLKSYLESADGKLDWVSAVELGSLLNQSETLRSMVTHDNSIKLERYVRAYIYLFNYDIVAMKKIKKLLHTSDLAMH